MLKPPPRTVKPEDLNDMLWRQFDALIGKSLEFTRDNSWTWRALTGPTIVERTMDSLKRMRQTLEAGVRGGRIPDGDQARHRRDLLHCRQDQARTAQKYFQKTTRDRDRAAQALDAITKHREACQDLVIIPEAHDTALWAVLADSDVLDEPDPS